MSQAGVTQEEVDALDHAHNEYTRELQNYLAGTPLPPHLLGFEAYQAAAPRPFTYNGTCIVIKQMTNRLGVPLTSPVYLRLDSEFEHEPGSKVPFHTVREAQDFIDEFFSADRDDTQYEFEETQIDPELDGAWYVAFRDSTDQFVVFNHAYGSGYPAGTVAGLYSKYGEAFSMAGAMNQSRGEWANQRDAVAEVMGLPTDQQIADALGIDLGAIADYLPAVDKFLADNELEP